MFIAFSIIYCGLLLGFSFTQQQSIFSVVKLIQFIENLISSSSLACECGQKIDKISVVNWNIFSFAVFITKTTENPHYCIRFLGYIVQNNHLILDVLAVTTKEQTLNATTMSWQYCATLGKDRMKRINSKGTAYRGRYSKRVLEC